MSNMECPQCGAPISPDATECRYCGEKIATHTNSNQQINQTNGSQQPNVYNTYYVGNYNNNSSMIPMDWPIRNKTVTALLAIFVGGFGAHKFYLGKTGQAFAYLLLMWTTLPFFIGFFEGIYYLCMSEQKFQEKYHVRVR